MPGLLRSNDKSPISRHVDMRGFHLAQYFLGLKWRVLCLLVALSALLCVEGRPSLKDVAKAPRQTWRTWLRYGEKAPNQFLAPPIDRPIPQWNEGQRTRIDYSTLVESREGEKKTQNTLPPKTLRDKSPAHWREGKQTIPNGVLTHERNSAVVDISRKGRRTRFTGGSSPKHNEEIQVIAYPLPPPVPKTDSPRDPTKYNDINTVSNNQPHRHHMTAPRDVISGEIQEDFSFPIYRQREHGEGYWEYTMLNKNYKDNPTFIGPKTRGQ